MPDADASVFVPLWQRARQSFTGDRISTTPAAFDVRTVRMNGHVDAITYHSDPGLGPLTRGLHAEADTVAAREIATDRLFVGRSIGTAATGSYVRHPADGNLVFDLPGVESILSDEFAATHCFGIEGTHGERIAVTFAPRAVVADVVDISGSLFFDRLTGEPRHLEFTYTNIPADSIRLCDPDASSDYGRSRPCQTFVLSRMGLGGEADLARIESGDWLMTQWTIRTIPDQETWRVGLKSRLAAPHVWTKCLGERDCEETWFAWPRLVTVSSIVRSVRRNGHEIYRIAALDPVIAAIDKRRGGEHPSRVNGSVTDATGRPLTGAVIQAEAPARVAVTDSSGLFQFLTLPPSPLVLSVRCRGYVATRFSLALIPDSVRHVTVRLAQDSTEADTRQCWLPR